MQDVGICYSHYEQPSYKPLTISVQCPQPVIVVSHSACIGGGIDLMCAADIRMCTQDAYFSIKEVDIGLAADVGTLQRIQHVYVLWSPLD